jgi:uncharacterized MnhB-related membrane protein
MPDKDYFQKVVVDQKGEMTMEDFVKFLSFTLIITGGLKAIVPVIALSAVVVPGIRSVQKKRALKKQLLESPESQVTEN